MLNPLSSNYFYIISLLTKISQLRYARVFILNLKSFLIYGICQWKGMIVPNKNFLVKRYLLKEELSVSHCPVDFHAQIMYNK